jgi:hypothetical protein
MWFPGSQEAQTTKQGKQGKLPGHAHNAVLSGIKTQALSSSQTGQGGYNQIVFDDSPGQSRLGLQSHGKHQGSHAGETELNLGALRQQTDNQRLGAVGYGFELKTHYSGALRSGAGMLISADKRAGNESGGSSHQMDSKEALSQLQTSQDLIKSLHDTAQQHKAMLPVLKTTEAKPDKLPVMQSFAQLTKSLQVVDVKDAGTSSHADKQKAAELTKYDMHFFVQDEVTGKPLANIAYRITLETGKFIEGKTDKNGLTKKVSSDTAISAKLEAPYYGDSSSTTDTYDGHDTCSC